MTAEDLEAFVREWWRRDRRRRAEHHTSSDPDRCGHTPAGFRPGVLDCTRPPHGGNVPHQYEKNRPRRQ